MVLTLNITPDMEARLRAKAADAGMDVETFAARQLERAVELSRKLADISGPVADAFEHSGMSEEELSEFLEKEKHLMRAERRPRNGP